jgi:hypothetical protein
VTADGVLGGHTHDFPRSDKAGPFRLDHGDDGADRRLLGAGRLHWPCRLTRMDNVFFVVPWALSSPCGS